MEEAQEKQMDGIASFKSGKTLKITGEQYNVHSENLMINLLVSSNRYGYIFYATVADGLIIIPSTYIDQESSHLSKSSDDDDNVDNENNKNNSIIRRSYIPGQALNKILVTPYWIALNADETILTTVLLHGDKKSWIILFYDVVKLIQVADSQPICPPIRLSSDAIGGTIQMFTWNPAIPTRFAYLDGNGSVAVYELDQISKQVKPLGQSNPDGDTSSISWSSKGKQIAVAKYDGTLELYEPNMSLKKTHPSVANDASYPPCISVLWISTHQFLLGFSEENADDNSFFHILVTYEKDQPPKILVYNDLFFDAFDASPDINPQYFYARINEWKMIITGLSKSLKIHVLGTDELYQDSLHIWSFDDASRATVKSSTNVNTQRPIVTGMAIGLNSTLSISDGNRKLPPCPTLLISTNEGILLVYYFIHKNLPSVNRKPDVIKSSADPTPTNGLPFGNLGLTTTTTPINPMKPPVTTPSSIIDNVPKSIATTGFSTMATPVQTLPAKPIEKPAPSFSQLRSIIDDFQTKLRTLQRPISKPTNTSVNLERSLGELTTALNNMTTTLQTSIRSIKTMTNEHVESLTKIENARHQIKLCQKENLYHFLKDRELDPWTQARLDLIKSNYDQLKHNLNVLLQLTRATIHDRSLSNTNNDDDDNDENVDFLPDLEISLNEGETMQQRLQNRIKELSHKVTKVDEDLENICSKLKTDILSSSTFTKTTMSSTRTFHASDDEILRHLEATHPKVDQICVPSTTVINLSSINEPKKQSTIEINKPSTPLSQPSTPQQINYPIPELEGFKNTLRFIQTSIDFISGALSPEQIQEISNVTAASPLSSLSPQKSNFGSINRTPTVPKTAGPPKTNTITAKPLQTTMAATNILQTPAKSVSSPIPTISVTPATPATQVFSSDSSVKLQPTKPAISTAVDLTKIQSTSGDSAIRSLLNNSVSPPTTIVSIPSQPVVAQAAKPPFFGNIPTTSAATPIINQSSVVPATITTTTTATPVISTPTSAFGAPPPQSPALTATTSVQSTSPTTKPIMSTGFGSKPMFGGTGFNLTSTTSASLSFGSSVTSTAPTTTTFGSGGFGAATSTTATTSAPSTSAFTSPSSPVPSPFGSGFGASTTTTSSAAPTSGIFGASTATTSSAAPTSSIFGASATSSASPFGSGFASALSPTASAPSTSTFGSGFGSSGGSFGTTTTTSSSSPFGGGFGTTTTASSSSPFGGGFGTATTTSSSSPFGGSFGTTTTTSASTPFGAAPTISTGTPFGASLASTPSTGTFGSSPAFGSGFSGFNTQSNLSGPSTGFSFGGFGGSQPSDASKPPSGFGSFGAAAGGTQGSPFGGSIFGGASGQPSGFGSATPSSSSSAFGASSTQSSSSTSFTNYRK